MTDARLPDRWLSDRRVLRLGDGAFRLFVTSLMWSVANRTDGVLDDEDLALIPRADPGCHEELVKTGLWERDADRWVVTVFADSQTSRSELDALAARRRSDRERKAAQRLRAAMSRDVSRDSHAESVRTGQARQGQDVQGGTVEDPWAHDVEPGSSSTASGSPAADRRTA